MVCAWNSRSLNGNSYSVDASATVQSLRSEGLSEDKFPLWAVSRWLTASVMVTPDIDFAAGNSGRCEAKSSAGAGLKRCIRSQMLLAVISQIRTAAPDCRPGFYDAIRRTEPRHRAYPSIVRRPAYGCLRTGSDAASRCP